MRIDAFRRGLPAMLFGVCSVLCAFVLLVPMVYAQEGVMPLEETDVQEEASPNAPLSAELSDALFTVAPVVANEKAKARDIIKKELVLTNQSGQRQDLYITVENIDPSNGAQTFVAPGASDLSTSLANWIEITRGVVKLGPGESRKIPYLIHVNLTAKPGSYFARIGVTKGAQRAYSDEIAPDASLMLNVEVMDDAHERLSLGTFTSDSSIVFGRSVGFSYMLENIGNRVIEPRGSIRIFNRRGEEVGSVPLNANGEEITPNNTTQLAAAWSAEGRFGKYKAFMDLEYGESQLASVQDTLYFWVFPWKEVFATLIGVFALGALGTFIVHMRSVARPVRARSASAYEKTNMYSYTSEHNGPTPVKHPVPQAQQYGSSPTVIAPRVRAMRSASPDAHQSLVAVPATHQGRPSVSGNTVQLAPRR